MTKPVGQFDPKLGRIRTHTDDFFDHRAVVVKAIGESLKREAERKGKKQ